MNFTFEDWIQAEEGWSRHILLNGIKIACVRIEGAHGEDGEEIEVFGLLVNDSAFGWCRRGILHQLPAGLTQQQQRRHAMHSALASLPGWFASELSEAAKATS